MGKLWVLQNKEKMKFGLTLKGENHWRIQKEKAKSGYLGISKNLGSLGCATGAGLD